MIEKEYDILIFEKIKEKLVDLENNTVLLNLSLDIIKTIFVTSEDRINKFSKLLIEDIDEDIKKKKSNPSYMKNLFQPIFSAEKNYRLCIHTDSLKNNQETCDEVLKIAEEEKPKKIDSELLPKPLNDLLYEKAKSLLDSSMYEKFNKGHWKNLIKTTYDSFDLTTVIEKQ